MLSLGSIFGMGLLCYGIKKNLGLQEELMHTFCPKNNSRITIEAVVLQVPDPPVENEPFSFDGISSSIAAETGPQKIEIDDGVPPTMAATEAFRLASQLVVSAVEADTNHEFGKARGLYKEALPLFDIALLSDDSEFSPAQRNALLSRVESYRLRAIVLLQKKSAMGLPPEV